jgi:hypothetical protein
MFDRTVCRRPVTLGLGQRRELQQPPPAHGIEGEHGVDLLEGAACPSFGDIGLRHPEPGLQVVGPALQHPGEECACGRDFAGAESDASLEHRQIGVRRVEGTGPHDPAQRFLVLLEREERLGETHGRLEVGRVCRESGPVLLDGDRPVLRVLRLPADLVGGPCIGCREMHPGQ